MGETIPPCGTAIPGLPMFVARRAVDADEPESRCGLPARLPPHRRRAAGRAGDWSGLAGLPADPGERDPPRREEALPLPTTWRTRYRSLMAIRDYTEGAAMWRPHDASAAVGCTCRSISKAVPERLDTSRL